LAVKIRMRRLGKKKRAFFRMVAIDSRMSRDGRFLEILGHYNPIEKPATIKVFEDRLVYWLNQGAEMSSTVKTLMAQIGFTQKYELLKKGEDVSEISIKNQITERPKKRKKTKAAKAEEVSAPADEKPEAAAPEKTEAKAEEKIKKKVEVKAEEKSEEKTEEKADDKTE